MDDGIDRLLTRCGGAVARSVLLRHGVSVHAIDNQVRSGLLVTAATDVYCRPWDVDVIGLRERAALLGLGRAAALSHLTALRRWDRRDATTDAAHVSVPSSRAPRSTDRLVVHRVARFPPVVRLDGLVTVTLAEAIATSWPLLEGTERRGVVIDAVRDRVVTPGEVLARVGAHRRLAGRAELRELVSLLDVGCESELEIWGHLAVFDADGLRHAVRQHVVRAGGRTFRLDLAYLEERVAVEMDGHRFHSSAEQRERDMRRDALLAAHGWVTLRFSHRRLHTDIPGCRRDTLAVLAARRRR